MTKTLIVLNVSQIMIPFRSFEFLVFEFVSYFVFRYSDLIISFNSPY